ncbi:MAG TPA: hypothetical protein VGC47_02385 [Acidimicrobiia bacterium]|jgi:hypothetical protein
MPFVVAHQGGWDEVLYIVVPVLAALLAVRWAERRRRETPPDDRHDVPGE